MSEEMSFEKIRSILDRYNTPEKQRPPRLCCHKRCISSISAVDLLNEIISRDTKKMDSCEYKKYCNLVRLIHRGLPSRINFKMPELLCITSVLLIFAVLFTNCVF